MLSKVASLSPTNLDVLLPAILFGYREVLQKNISLGIWTGILGKTEMIVTHLWLINRKDGGRNKYYKLCTHFWNKIIKFCEIANEYLN